MVKAKNLSQIGFSLCHANLNRWSKFVAWLTKKAILKTKNWPADTRFKLNEHETLDS